jgi:predicted TIM-barrel fold metal-dependent hydrolase
MTSDDKPEGPSGVVVDLWANLRSPAASAAWADASRQGVSHMFAASARQGPRTVTGVLEEMDASGVDYAIVNGQAPWRRDDVGLNYVIDEVLDQLSTVEHFRVSVAVSIESPFRVNDAVRAVKLYSQNDHVTLVRIIPMLIGECINSRMLYPIYAACEEVGLPVSINVGIPGPARSLRWQRAELLDDVLIDFPDLVVVAAHMGHPWESLLIQLMRKYPTLYLSSSAYLPAYMTDETIRFVNSSAGRGRVAFASDSPMISMDKALRSARDLPISKEALAAYLGGAAGAIVGGGRFTHR